jgi:hypothetical protein
MVSTEEFESSGKVCEESIPKRTLTDCGQPQSQSGELVPDRNFGHIPTD